MRVANYNVPGERRGVRCAEHRLEGMVNDVLIRKCKKDGCTVAARFNMSGKRNGSRCLLHKFEGMVEVQRRFVADDVQTRFEAMALDA